MRAAICSRFSTDRQSESSIADQESPPREVVFRANLPTL